MKKRSEIIGIIKLAVAADFKNKTEAAKAFGVSSNMLSLILGGRIPSPGVLSYIGYEKVDVYRSIIDHRKRGLSQIITRVNTKKKEFGNDSNTADFFCCTPQHLRAIIRSGRSPSRTMCAFAGVYKTDEYKKVK